MHLRSFVVDIGGKCDSDFGISAIVDPNPFNSTRTRSNSKRRQIKRNRTNSGKYKYNFDHLMKTRVGTLAYTAPEILKRGRYDERVDYWSLGVIMYILVCGYLPFDGDDDYSLCEDIISENIEFDEEDWTHVGHSTQDLIDRLLSKNPRQRANCQDIIEHSWKINVKNSGFLKAHNKFKQTVFRRKVKARSRANTGNHEKELKLWNQNRLKQRMQRLKDLSINALDDSVVKQQRNSNVPIDIVQFESEQKEKQIDSWKVGKRQSKTTEYLQLDTMMPNIITTLDELNEDVYDLNSLPELPSFDIMTYSNRSSAITSGSDMPSIISPSMTYSHSQNSALTSHSLHHSRSGLSSLTSQSFVDSLSNKRKRHKNDRSISLKKQRLRKSQSNKSNNSNYSSYRNQILKGFQY